MPGYCASNALPSFSPTGRSIDEYRITLPSFFAASTRSGVIDTGAGAAAITRVANAVSPSEAEPLMTSRRDNFFRITQVSHSSLRGAKRRSNPDLGQELDCFASLAMTA